MASSHQLKQTLTLGCSSSLASAAAVSTASFSLRSANSAVRFLMSCFFSWRSFAWPVRGRPTQPCAISCRLSVQTSISALHCESLRVNLLMATAGTQAISYRLSVQTSISVLHCESLRVNLLMATAGTQAISYCRLCKPLSLSTCQARQPSGIAPTLRT